MFILLCKLSLHLPDSVRALSKPELELLANFLEIQYNRDLRKEELLNLLLETMFSINVDIHSGNTDLSGARSEEETEGNPSPDVNMQLEMARIQLELQKAKFDHEYRMKRLESNGRKEDSFNVTKNVQMVPPFNECDVTKYFQMFEKVAQRLECQEWPNKYWTLCA